MRWLFVSAIDEMVPDSFARGRTSFPPETWFFQDHFPGFPVVPGVILLEAMAQLSGKLIGWSVKEKRGHWPFPILSMANNAKFRKFVRPDDEVVLETRIRTLNNESAGVDVRAFVGGKMHAQAEQIFVFNAVPLSSPEEAARVERLERAELQRLWKGYSSSDGCSSEGTSNAGVSNEGSSNG